MWMRCRLRDATNTLFDVYYKRSSVQTNTPRYRSVGFESLLAPVFASFHISVFYNYYHDLQVFYSGDLIN